MHLELAIKAAKKARQNAYTPYSRFKVGAALKLKGSDMILSGCNVENSSFGAAVCGERNAFFKAVAEFGQIEPEFMVLVTEESAMPCGICRQVMSEFCKPDFKIYIANLNEVVAEYEFKDLLPHMFDKSQLPS